jgi:hypothetical protein
VTPAPAPGPHHVEKFLVSPDPLPATWALYNTLLAKYGSGDIFSGQADPTGVTWLEQSIGKTPAIIGLDMIDYSPTRVVSYPGPATNFRLLPSTNKKNIRNMELTAQRSQTQLRSMPAAVLLLFNGIGMPLR